MSVTAPPIWSATPLTPFALLNLVDTQLEVYSDPSGPAANPGYRQPQTYRTGEALPLVIGSQNAGSIAVRDLLA
ncbi:MAG: hypothetical protein GX575_10080 [Candidatus Anammoximicrobium sp.]|nr:hypothetical protein [Candidatus Anammoximicrobium sp.]